LAAAAAALSFLLSARSLLNINIRLMLCASALFEDHSIKTLGITQKQINITLCFEAPVRNDEAHFSPRAHQHGTHTIEKKSCTPREQGTNYVLMAKLQERSDYIMLRLVSTDMIQASRLIINM
jgi:hypothetical protein